MFLGFHVSASIGHGARTTAVADMRTTATGTGTNCNRAHASAGASDILASRWSRWQLSRRAALPAVASPRTREARSSASSARRVLPRSFVWHDAEQVRGLRAQGAELRAARRGQGALVRRLRPRPRAASCSCSCAGTTGGPRYSRIALLLLPSPCCVRTSDLVEGRSSFSGTENTHFRGPSGQNYPRG